MWSRRLIRSLSWERSRSLRRWRGRVPTWPVIAACRGRSGHGGGTRSSIDVKAQDALRGEDLETAGVAVTAMIDLACETRERDYFRSEDPLEAARFVVSDAVAVLWSRTREVHGAVQFTESAAAQLLRWESRYGWTRRGEGWASARETSLARVLSQLLVVPDLWSEVARHYVDALDRVAEGGRDQVRGRRSRQQRAEDLSEWNALLVGRLAGSDHEDLLDRLVAHPALAGPELTFLQARLAHERGELEAAGALVKRCLTSLPGHPEFRIFAEAISAHPPGLGQKTSSRLTERTSLRDASWGVSNGSRTRRRLAGTGVDDPGRESDLST